MTEPYAIERQLFRKHQLKMSKQNRSIERKDIQQRENGVQSIDHNKATRKSQTKESRDTLVSMLDKMNRQSSCPSILEGANTLFEKSHYLYRKKCQIFPAENLQTNGSKGNELIPSARIGRRHSVQSRENNQSNSNAFTRSCSVTKSRTDTITVTKFPNYAVKREKLDTLLLMHQLQKEKYEANEYDPIFTKCSKEIQEEDREYMQLLNGRYAKDYVSIAMKYARLSKYKNNCVQKNTQCIKCLSRSNSGQKSSGHNKDVFPFLSKVFYPCEHRCICDQCFQGRKWDTCPWCNEQVKVIVNKTGLETDEYWKWINEVKRPLPLKFHKHFLRLSKQNISETMVLSIEEAVCSDGSSCNSSYSSELNYLEIQKNKICKIL